MSAAAFYEVWEHSSASGSTLLAMLALADNASPSGVAYPNWVWLASKSRLDEEAVRLALRAMQASGELDVWEWYDKRTDRTGSCYRITVGALAARRGKVPKDIESYERILVSEGGAAR